ncbi:MAG TPA: hypothetical protein DCO79_01040 [Spirochaeta sp.]|nr:hypothetical protein [Spirochaeta sp.]
MIMSSYNGLKFQLKTLRRQKKMTQSSLAEMLGVGQTTIANYENGQRFPDEEILIRLADIFNVTMDNLLGRELSTEEAVERPPSMFSYQPSILGTKRDEFMDKALNSSRKAVDMIISLYKSGYSEEQVLIDLLEASLSEAGRRWAEGRYNEAMEHQLSMTVVQAMFILQSYATVNDTPVAKAALLTSAGEGHNIGLKMLSRFLEIDSWECYYLGSSVPGRTLQEYISSSSINLVLISVTMNENVDSACSLISALRQLENPPLIMAGGAGAKLNRKILIDSGADYIDKTIVDTMSFTKKIKNNLVLQ